MDMLILGIDTSCDDTSASVVEDGCKIISNVVSNQNEIHKRYGGIVPELASRRHIEMIVPIVDEALKVAHVGIKDMAAIAVCHGPGLIGSLLVGVCFAKSLSLVYRRPLVAINHLEGHICSIFLERRKPDFPFISLVVSGGHTNIYRVNGFGSYIELGRTRDDAAGEAFDKVAKLLDLGYPGGPLIEISSLKGDPSAITFSRPYPDRLDFSFSGLKTAVLNHLKKNPHVRKEDVAAGFQSAVIDVLINRTIQAARKEGIKRVSLSGGVAANSVLRDEMEKRCAKEDIEVYLPSINLCTDNGAMIASAGFFRFERGDVADFSLNPKAYLPLGQQTP